MDKNIYNFGKEDYFYENTSNMFEEIFCIGKAGKTYPDPTYSIERFAPDKYYKFMYIFEYVISGEGIIECDDRQYVVREGDFYILTNNCPHRYYSSPDNPFTKVWINVGGRLVNELANFYGIKSGVTVKHMDCRAIFRDIETEVKCITENSREEISRRVFKLLIRLFDLLTDDKKSNAASNSAYKVRNFIDANIQSDIKLENIMTHFFFSKSYLINSFKQEFSVSPKQYILHKKIEIAKNMLLNTSLPIKTIGERLYFSDGHHFSNTFKKITGMTPREFRLLRP